MEWTLYLIRCADGSLYTGITTDVARRLDQHRAGEGLGARYLRGRGPLRLVLKHPVGSRSLALRLERLIKRLPKADKERLVACPEELAGLLDRLDEPSSTAPR